MHIDRRRVTKISCNAFVSRRSLSKSSRDYDSSSTTYSRKRMTGVGFSACSTRYASIRLSNSLCQYALPNLYISHFAISIPHMRSRHLQHTQICQPVHIAGEPTQADSHLLSSYIKAIRMLSLDAPSRNKILNKTSAIKHIPINPFLSLSLSLSLFLFRDQILAKSDSNPNPNPMLNISPSCKTARVTVARRFGCRMDCQSCYIQ
jgi:hypothetical protein